jgi:DNA polymerase III sliding clamp (beta) subunit (PCNA family)
MIVCITKLKLLDLLKKVAGAVCKTSKNSLFSSILLKVIDNKIFCIAINEFIEIVVYDNLNEKCENTEIVIEYDLIYNIIKKVDQNENIIIKQERKHIEIIAGNSVFKLNKSFDIFPSFELSCQNLLKIRIDASFFLKMLNNIKTSVSDHNPQLFLNGIFFDLSNNCLNGFSSDGFRLSYFNILHDSLCNNSFKFILPKSTVTEILNIFVKSSHIYVFFFTNQIKFISDRITLTSKLINDIYNIPVFDLNLFCGVRLTLKTLEIKDALEKISSLKMNDEKAIFSLSYNKITIKAGSLIQNVTIFLSIENSINNVQFGFNYKHFKDILKLIETNVFDFSVSSNNNFLLIKEINSNFLHIMTAFNL